MSSKPADPEPLPEVLAYYEAAPEESRLESGVFRLEYERTREILARVLPAPPARVADVGGGAGVYAFWLADLGYDVNLLDASPRLIAEARQRDASRDRRLASIRTGDARRLPFGDGEVDAVLLLGPLYHLPALEERQRALREARRVLVPGGVVAAAAISRFASTLSGLTTRLAKDPLFVRMRDRALADGRHVNDTGRLDYFTTAYFHKPDDLQEELDACGFEHVQVLGVEGPGWMLPDFEAHWTDDDLRQGIMDAARALEAEPSILGASAHLIALGRRR